MSSISPWPAALTSAGVGAAVAIVLSLGIGAVISPAQHETTPSAVGVDGNDGSDGNDGAKGADGSNGRDGAGGQDGADGRDGAVGRDGAARRDGAAGRDGIDGVAGATGPTGAAGAAGAAGASGPTGPAGTDAVTAYAEETTLHGTYFLQNGAHPHIHNSTAELSVAPTSIEPGTYVLTLTVERMSVDLGAPNRAVRIACYFRGSGLALFNLPPSAMVSFDGTVGSHWAVTATRQVTVANPNAAGIRCSASHTDTWTDNDPNLTLVNPSITFSALP